MKLDGRTLTKFRRRIEVDDETDCWLWTGSTTSSGHGYIKVRKKGYLAHRISWEHYISKIPEGIELHHTCGAKQCVNPEHLQLVTHEEHMRIHRDGLT